MRTRERNRLSNTDEVLHHGLPIKEAGHSPLPAQTLQAARVIQVWPVLLQIISTRLAVLLARSALPGKIRNTVVRPVRFTLDPPSLSCSVQFKSLCFFIRRWIQKLSYVCGSDIDCTTAVNNFPICANSTWNMFVSSTGGYFCCSPGQIGVNDMTMTGGLCEPYDQVVPSNLLATLVSQATATAAAISGTASATATSGAPLETNPTLSPTASDSGAGGLGDSALNSGSYVPLSTPAIIGIGVGASIAITVVIVIGICLRRRPKKIIVNEAFLCTPYEPNFPDQYCSRHEVVHKLPPYTAMETAGGG